MTASDERGENGGYPARRQSPKSSDGTPFRRRLKRRLKSDVETKWGDVILIGCYFCSGVIDSVAFNVYACFVSMQTGNTIFVGLGVSGQPSVSPTFAWTRSLTAIVSFCLGAFTFATFHRLATPLRRSTLIISFAFQTLLIIIPAILVTLGVVSNSTRTPAQKTAETTQSVRISTAQFPWLDLLPIALLAFQSAGQVVASRVLKFNALPTVVLTSLYADLMSDAHLLTAGIFEDPQRNRRVCGVVALFAGAVLGGFLSKSWVGYGGALWIVAGVKGCMVLAWLLWKGKDTGEGQPVAGAPIENG